MTTFFRITLATLFLTALAAQDVRVRYLANEGFLLEGDGSKVLIDALFGDGLNGYAVVPTDTRTDLESARAPFDNVNLILATHFHADHFDASAVARHLRANPESRFISTPQATSRLEPLIRNEPEVRARVESVYPPEGETLELSRAGVRLEVFRLHHGRGRRPPVQNLGFLIRLGNFQVLHVGDTEATAGDFEPYRLVDKVIDVALLPAWFLTYDHWKAAVREQIRPRRIAVMHLALASAPRSYFGPDGSYEARISKIRQDFPAAVIFEEPGTERTFSAQGVP